MTAISCPSCGHLFVLDVDALYTASKANAGVQVTHDDPRKEFSDILAVVEKTEYYAPDTFHELLKWGHRVPYGDRKDVRSRIMEFLIRCPPIPWKWEKADDLRRILEDYLK